MPATPPSIVFAHGLWADGSCFSKLIPTLLQEGHQVASAQNTLESLEGDVDVVHRTLARVDGPVILVGHSWGGVVITAAGTHDRVAGLVYIAAIGQDAGETPQDLIGRYDPPSLFAHLDTEEGRLWIARDGISHFCGDLPEEEQQLIWATQGAPSAELFGAKSDNVAWKTKPSWYIVAKQDRTINPDLERFMAQRMGATTVEADTSHVPMLSNPALVLDSIRAAARSV